MKKLLACVVAVLCVVSIATLGFAGGYEAPVKAVATCSAAECGHNGDACGGLGCCHVHTGVGHASCQHGSNHGTTMPQRCGVCSQDHGTTLIDGACFMHNLGCAWKQLNNAGQTAVCCTLGVFKDAMNLWGLMGGTTTSESSSVVTTETAKAETK